MQNIIWEYNNSLKAIYDHVWFIEYENAYAIKDCTNVYWFLDNDSITYSSLAEHIFDESWECYTEEIDQNRYYEKSVYIWEEFTLIFCNPHEDGARWFRVFANEKRQMNENGKEAGSTSVWKLIKQDLK